MPESFRLLVSTSLRSGRRVDGAGEEISGSLILAELEPAERTFRALKQVELPRSPHRPLRNSVRGVARFAGGIAVCNTSQLFLLDEALEEIVAEHSDPRFGDIHTLAVRDGVLYVTATASDSILGLDHHLATVFEWWAGSEEALARRMEAPYPAEALTSHDFRRKGPCGNQFHINHVFWDAAGDMIVNLPYLDLEPGLSKFWNVTRRRFHLPQSFEVNPIEGRVHDGVILDGHHYFAWTEHGDFVKLSAASGEIVQRVNCSVPLGWSTGSPLARQHGWLRGSVHLGDELFLVGQSRLNLFLVDMRRGKRSGPLRLIDVKGELDHPGLATYCITRLD